MAMPNPVATEGQPRIWVFFDKGGANPPPSEKPGKKAPGGAVTLSASMTICVWVMLVHLHARLVCFHVVETGGGPGPSAGLFNAGSNRRPKIAMMQ